MKINLPIFIIFCIVSGFLCIFGVQKCVDKNLNEAVLSAQDGANTQTIVDSVKNAYRWAEIAKIDSVNKVYAEQAKESKQSADKFKKIACNLAKKTNAMQAELDSLKSINAPCTDQLDLCVEIGKQLRNEMSAKDTVIKDLDREALSYSLQLYNMEKKYNETTDILAERTKTFNANDEANKAFRKQAATKQKTTQFWSDVKSIAIVALGIFAALK